MWASGGLFTLLLPFDLWTIVFWRGFFATVFIGAYVLYRFGPKRWLPRTGYKNGLLDDLKKALQDTHFKCGT